MESYSYGNVMESECATRLVGLEREAVYQYAVPVQLAACSGYLHLAFIDGASVREAVVKAEPYLLGSHYSHPDLRLLLGYLAVYTQDLFFSQTLEILLARSNYHAEHVNSSGADQNPALICIVAVGAVLAARNDGGNDLTVTVEGEHVHARFVLAVIDGHT